MTPEPRELSVEEFRALRATIRERGSLRLFVAPITFMAWAAAAIVVHIWASSSLLGLVPLVVLAAGFEAVLSLHVGVERVGRFLQVFYESDRAPLPGWEHAAMNAAPITKPTLSIDPVFGMVFLAATVLNLLVTVTPALVDAETTGLFWGVLSMLALAHALFATRVVSGRRFCAGQRARDLEMYRRYAETRGRDRSN